MKSEVMIAVSIISGLMVLFVILGLIFSRVREKLEKLVAAKFAKEEILGATTQAKFLGLQSKGGAQIRGNGALVLTRNEIYFLRAVPQTEYKIPVASIRMVSMPRFFKGKSALVPLLCITYDTEHGEDSVAWALRQLEKWKDASQKLIT